MANESNGTNIMSQPDSTPESGDSEFAMMYYGLGIVAAAGLLLLAYNIIVIKCCVNRSTRRRVDGAPTTLVMLSRQGRSNQGMAARRRVEELVSFKYQKDEEATTASSVGSVECAVCLSMFEEGEEIKQLPRNADGFESWHTFMAHQAGPLLLPSVRWWRGTSSTGLLDMDLDLDLDHGSVSWSSQDLVSWKEQPRERQRRTKASPSLLCIVLVLLYAMYRNIMECERRWKAMNPEHNFHVFSRQRVAYGDIYGSPSDVR